MSQPEVALGQSSAQPDDLLGAAARVRQWIDDEHRQLGYGEVGRELSYDDLTTLIRAAHELAALQADEAQDDAAPTPPQAPALDRYYLIGTDEFGEPIFHADPRPNGEDHGAVEYVRADLVGLKNLGDRLDDFLRRKAEGATDNGVAPATPEQRRAWAQEFIARGPETLAERQLRELRTPGSASAVAPSGGQLF